MDVVKNKFSPFVQKISPSCCLVKFTDVTFPAVPAVDTILSNKKLAGCGNKLLIVSIRSIEPLASESMLLSAVVGRLSFGLKGSTEASACVLVMLIIQRKNDRHVENMLLLATLRLSPDMGILFD